MYTKKKDRQGKQEMVKLSSAKVSLNVVHSAVAKIKDEASVHCPGRDATPLCLCEHQICSEHANGSAKGS